MKTIALLSFLLLLSVHASPTDSDHDNDNDDSHHGCLSREDAHRFLTYYVKFFENMTDPSTLAFAQANIADDFQLFSDSTNNFLGNAVSFISPTSHYLPETASDMLPYLVRLPYRQRQAILHRRPESSCGRR
jgi:hypothetical protein